MLAPPRLARPGLLAAAALARSLPRWAYNLGSRRREPRLAPTPAADGRAPFVDPIRPAYRSMAWEPDPGGERLRRWQQGQTGYPLVDAAMRELWTTGWIQQSVRMAAAAFLTEYLNLSWVHGARWFHDTLVDACAPPRTPPAGGSMARCLPGRRQGLRHQRDDVAERGQVRHRPVAVHHVSRD